MLKLFSIFTKNKLPKDFFSRLQDSEPDYICIEVEENTIRSTLIKDQKQTIGMDIGPDTARISLASNTYKVSLEDSELLSILKNLNRVCVSKIEESKELLHKFPNISNPSEGEIKGEEWLKVTNHVLKESLKKAEQDKKLILEAKLFIGKKSHNDEFNIRIQCYNLDYSLSFLENGKVYLSVFDDKNFERGHAKTPSYNGEFFNNRPVILDEFIKVIVDIFSKSDLKIF